MSNFVVPKKAVYQEILQKIQEEELPIDISSLESILQLLQFTSYFSSVVEKYFAHYGLSQGRFSLMILLFTHPKTAWTPASLADNMEVTRATITGLLDGLEKSAWVERKLHPKDRRRLIIELTQKGHDFMKQMLPKHFQRASQFMAVLSKEEQGILKGLFDKISTGLPALTNFN